MVVTKAKFSNVLKIGQTIGKKKYTEDDFYCNMGGERVLHLNALAWEAPSVVNINGKEIHGFVPGDRFYDEIIKELKGYADRYRAGNIVRKVIPYSEYDLMAKWIPEVKMVTWWFVKSNEYCVD